MAFENSKVRAKFKLVGVKRYIANQWDDFRKSSHEMPVSDFEFNAVGRDANSDENTAFWKSTPSGTIKVSVVNDSAVRPEGQSYPRERGRSHRNKVVELPIGFPKKRGWGLDGPCASTELLYRVSLGRPREKSRSIRWH